MNNNSHDAVLVTIPDSNHFETRPDVKFTIAPGRLYPIDIQQVSPGDHHTLDTQHFMRFMPMLFPSLTRYKVHTESFFIPYRILDPRWPQFITGGDDAWDGAPPPPVTLPFATFHDIKIGSIMDYMGVPPNIDYSVYPPVATERVNGQPLLLYNMAAYSLTWDEWYRDQNLQEKRFVPLNEGDDNLSYLDFGINPPYFRNYRHDRFTSVLPFVQKGAPVMIPLGNSAPVYYDDTEIGEAFRARLRNPEVIGHPLVPPGGMDAAAFAVGGTAHTGVVTDGDNFVSIDNANVLKVDLTAATAATVNDLREAFAAQRFLELDARVGTRYTEFLRAHYGVIASDKSLQRPQFLGGGVSHISISEVLQNSATLDGSTPLANMAGHGIGAGASRQYSTYFEEYGVVMTLLSVMPEPAYSQGLRKDWFKFDREDYMIPLLDQLGEQPLKNIEIFWGDDETEIEHAPFGYEPMYEEYRRNESRIGGLMRTSFSAWHDDRLFATRPTLNSSFIECNPPNRIFAVQGLPDAPPIDKQDFIVLYVKHNRVMKRKLARFNIPTIR